MVNRLTEAQRKSLQVIQNNAIRTIFRVPFRAHTPTVELGLLSGLGLVEERMKELNTRYFIKALVSENELILDLFKSFRNSFSCREGCKTTIISEEVNLLEQYL